MHMCKGNCGPLFRMLEQDENYIIIIVIIIIVIIISFSIKVCLRRSYQLSLSPQLEFQMCRHSAVTVDGYLSELKLPKNLFLTGVF